MKKLPLTLDELAMESFARASEPAPRGTVEGHAVSMQPGQCLLRRGLPTPS